MLRFFAPQHGTGGIFSVQFGAAVVITPPPDPQDPTPPSPPAAIELTAGAPSTAAPSTTTGQLKLEREFASVAAPATRTVMLAKPGSPAL